MKKEAVTTRPTASMKTAKVGYHASGTGLAIGLGACSESESQNTKKGKSEINGMQKIDFEIAIERFYHGSLLFD